MPKMRSFVCSERSEPGSLAPQSSKVLFPRMWSDLEEGSSGVEVYELREDSTTPPEPCCIN